MKLHTIQSEDRFSEFGDRPRQTHYMVMVLGASTDERRKGNKIRDH